MDYERALEFVERYYTNSWNSLLWLLAVAFGVIGILMPIILQWIQNRNNKKEIKLIKKEIELIKKENEALLEKKINDVEGKFSKIEKDMYNLQGKTYSTQGNIKLKSDTSQEKLIYYFLQAAYNYCRADNDKNFNYVRRTIEGIVNSDTFPNEIATVDDELNIRGIYDKILDLLEEKNKDGKYSSIISLLKEKVKFKNI